MRPLKALQPRHLAAIRLRVAGRNNEFIAEQLGIQETTLHQWFSDSMVLQALETFQTDVNEKLAEKLADNALSGLDVLADLAKRDTMSGPISVEQKMQIAREMLDRNPITNPELQRTGSVSFNRFDFSGLSDDELKKKAIELLRTEAKEVTNGAG